MPLVQGMITVIVLEAKISEIKPRDGGWGTWACFSRTKSIKLRSKFKTHDHDCPRGNAKDLRISRMGTPRGRNFVLFTVISATLITVAGTWKVLRDHSMNDSLRPLDWPTCPSSRGNINWMRNIPFLWQLYPEETKVFQTV